MTILLFGSTGRVGSLTLQKLLKLNHEVIAFVRNAYKLNLVHDKLSVIEGNILDNNALDKLKDFKVDGVINAIGSDPLKPSTLYTDTTRIIIQFLTGKKDVHYIGITGIAQMEKTLLGKLLIFILNKTPVKNAILDHQNAFNLVKESNLFWTLIGCPYIAEGEEIGKYHIDNKFRGGYKKIHPGDVAGAMVDELEKHNFQKIVGIWY